MLVRPQQGRRRSVQRRVFRRLRAAAVVRVVGKGVAVGGRAETLHRLCNRNRCSTATTALRRLIAYNVVLPNNCILRNQQNSRTYTTQPKTTLWQTEFWRTAILFHTSANYEERRFTVATQRHLSVGTYIRVRTPTLLLCAKRASGVRGVVIVKRQLT